METRNIAKNIREIVKNEVFETYLCKVVAVDAASCTVKRIVDDKEIPDVRLNASMIENEGFVIAPKVNSLVLVTNIDGVHNFISSYSKIDKITLDFDTEIIINGGENNGLVKIKQLNTRLKNLEKNFNDHTHTGNFIGTISGNPATGTLTVPAISYTSSEFQGNYSGYENDKIKH
jgi:hypothetical protein